MKILVVGAGLSGCTIAYCLKERGHDVLLIEKESAIGGLCVTKVNADGLKYEPFGARTFHTKNQKVKKFITRFDEFNGYTHRKGMVLNGKLFPFPITREAIDRLEERDVIIRELKSSPEKIDATNFETACISIFGKTLYRYFIENYTNKMWGTDPKNLTAEWAPKRLELRDDDSEGLFKGQWQGLPVHGYSFLLSNMIKDILVTLNRNDFDANDYDVVISSAPIDQTMNFRFGKLQYRGLSFAYKRDEAWENDNYGTINLPQHPRYVRKCNFKVLHKENSEHNWIQYQMPVSADNGNIPMYPINTEKNNEIFDKYLKEICTSKNICPLGRLGLFKYLDMDKAVAVALDMVAVVENYLHIDAAERYQKITSIINNY